MHFIQAEELEGVKIEMEEGLKLEGMLAISKLTSHRLCSFFGNLEIGSFGWHPLWMINTNPSHKIDWHWSSSIS